MSAATSMYRDLLGATVSQPQVGTYITLRVADPVHFRPDLDPANQNCKNRIPILLALTKNEFKHLNLFHINQISSDFLLIFLPEKMENIV